MYRLLISLVAALAFALPSRAAAEPLTIVADDVYAIGLLRLLASTEGRELIVAGYALDRISLNKSYDDIEGAVSDVVAQLGARMTIIDGVTTIYPPCRAPQKEPNLIPLQPVRISLSFDRIDPAELLSVIIDLHDLDVAQVPASNSPDALAIGIRVKDRSTSSVLKLIAVTTGVEFKRLAAGKLTIAYPKPDEACKPVSASRAELTVLGNRRIPITGPCPRPPYPELRQHLSKFWDVCGPMEYFDLATLVPRGYISGGKGPVALLETPDGTTADLRQREYVGHHFGKVTAIDAEGFTVEEIRQDLVGLYYVETTRISYRNERQSKSSNRLSDDKGRADPSGPR
jgi:hypothetical protein